jgi:hypothetical protein
MRKEVREGMKEGGSKGVKKSNIYHVINTEFGIKIVIIPEKGDGASPMICFRG